MNDASLAGPNPITVPSNSDIPLWKTWTSVEAPTAESRPWKAVSMLRKPAMAAVQRTTEFWPSDPGWNTTRPGSQIVSLMTMGESEALYETDGLPKESDAGSACHT